MITLKLTKRTGGKIYILSSAISNFFETKEEGVDVTRIIPINGGYIDVTETASQISALLEDKAGITTWGVH